MTHSDSTDGSEFRDEFGGREPASDTDAFGGPEPASDTDAFGGPSIVERANFRDGTLTLRSGTRGAVEFGAFDRLCATSEVLQ